MPTAPASDLSLALNRHKYRLPNGDIAVSVTAISGLMDDGKSSAFAYAAVKLAKQGIDFRKEWNARGQRGTRVHGHLEKFLCGEDIDQADDEKGYVDALEKFIVEHDPELIEQEAIVLSSHGYGGRFDLICRPRLGKYAGVNLLLDLKTGGAYVVEHCLQLSAYRYADGIATYNEDGSLADLRPLPPIDAAACLYVAQDGTYRLMEHPADESAHAAFLALLSAYNWTRTDAMKTAVKEAKDKP